MGHYTTFRLRISLKPETLDKSEHVIEALNRGEVPHNRSRHPFFERYQPQSIWQNRNFRSDIGSRFWIDEDGRRQVLVWSELKSYHDEIPAFLDWILPYAERPNGTPLAYGDVVGYQVFQDGDEGIKAQQLIVSLGEDGPPVKYDFPVLSTEHRPFIAKCFSILSPDPRAITAAYEAYPSRYRDEGDDYVPDPSIRDEWRDSLSVGLPEEINDAAEAAAKVRAIASCYQKLVESVKNPLDIFEETEALLWMLHDFTDRRDYLDGEPVPDHLDMGGRYVHEIVDQRPVWTSRHLLIEAAPQIGDQSVGEESDGPSGSCNV